MPYNSDATSNLSIDNESVVDWELGLPGQWYMGVVDTQKKSVKLAPVNIFDLRGSLNQQVLSNTSQQGINRYASGAPGEREGYSIMPSYLQNRPPGMTHHVAVMQQAGFDLSSSLGFSLIKINNRFAQMKMTSTSLNGDKPEARYHHSFSRATCMNTSGYYPTGAQLPIQWQHALSRFFKVSIRIEHICVSND
ncbi:hypothetical protein [Vibrio sp. 10N.261.55.A7]|uniref:hypothetical protein n=1 Tax=Vibrio sp. 10N.261.55.A7 TaxID=1880851 RepID=UPI000C820816|nr:hypothetical protein [Vibrio sp. 10N.261.55.A7]PMJ90596.1 hypothetical protein BCU12_11815 [Vibrio sp. 10N.261.55.A7]